jgi:hypothetical protein
MRWAQDKKHARQLQKELVKQLDSAEGNQRAELDAQKLTFAKPPQRRLSQETGCVSCAR